MPSTANYIPLDSSLRYPCMPFPRSLCISRKRILFLLVATSLLPLFIALIRDEIALYQLDFSLPTNPNYQPYYIPLPVSPSLPTPPSQRLHPVRDLPTECLEQHYSLGLPCFDNRGHLPIDVVWTWVNGSDPLFVQAKNRAVHSYRPEDPYKPVQSMSAQRMFRDHDELRHSIRSVLANFRNYTTRFHVLTSDVDYPDNVSDLPLPSLPHTDYWRLGLQPQWLDNSRPEWWDDRVRLSLIHHAHFFQPYIYPSFNSYGIETQLSNLPDVSEVFIYMNDDMFITIPMTSATFYSHRYGIVLRIDNTLSVDPDMSNHDAKGEWLTMGLTNYLLSKRFGSRRRSYVHHLPKTIHLPILRELALIWPDILAQTALHAFREREGPGDPDFYATFAFPHFLVERSREALLWTWTIGRIAGLDDSWGEFEMQLAWTELGGDLEGPRSQEIQVGAGMRDTLRRDRVEQYIEGSGIGEESRTNYIFSSMDGYAYNPYGPRTTGDWPGFEVTLSKNRKEHRMCTIKRHECFGQGLASDGSPANASAVFKQIAFNKPHCGDCVIVALTRASGRSGLSAFLPPSDRMSPLSASSEERTSDSAREIPHLPLVADWHDGQFALRDVMKYAPNTNVREWSMRLMQRYRYVIGETPSKFYGLSTLRQARSKLRSVDRAKDLALICLNDDVVKDHAAVDAYFRNWQEKRWPTPAAWESDQQ